jgi:insulysin
MKKYFLAFLLLLAASLQTAPYERIEDKCTLKILTPALAERKIAKIRLKNGLEAYLVSDPGIHESACALAVEAGSWQDPEEYPGMAHFLEHMLFMGTKAYPLESEYSHYIHDHGGDMNAYTASDRTVYAFSVANEAFIGACDRFSHFFIDPLFLPTCIERELHAVDQEHAKNIENDGWRSYMILKETGNPHHPNAGFSTGNAETLSGIPQEALKTWYHDHYSANRMHLVLLSSLPLNELIAEAAEKFSPIPNHNLKKASYPQGLLSPQQKGHFTYIKPVKDLKSVSLMWEVPLEVALDKETACSQFLKYVLSNESENSLSEELKREKLAENLSVSLDRWSAESRFFMIDIDLTEAGLKQLDTVIKLVFQTICRLKETGIPRYMFDEQRKIATLEYEYQSRQEAFSIVMEAVASLLDEDLSTFPEKLYLPSRFDPQMIQTLLSSLTPNTCAYFVLADPKLTGVEPTVQEKWMDASYTIKAIPSSQLLAWSEVRSHPNIDLPPPNPYLPESLALLPTELASSSPALLDSDELLGKAYFQQDKTYLVPETAAIFSLKTPLLDGSAKSRALFDLYNRALVEKLSSSIFFASQAGITLQTGQSNFDYKLSVCGYSEKTPLFLKTIFASLGDVLPTQAEFEIYQQSLLSSYDNASKELPFRQSMQLLNSILYNHMPLPSAKYAALKNLSYEEFLHFSQEAFKTAYAEAMIYGNLSQEQASTLWSTYKTTLSPQPFPPAEHYKKGVLYPKEADGPYMTQQTTQRQGNSVALVIHEGPFSQQNRAIQQILSSALKDDFFDTLRTRQQTGYIATSSDLEVERQLLQFFAVQSNTHEPPELLARFELFLEEFSRHLQEKISPSRFETLKASLIKELAMPPDNLPAKAGRLQTLAFDYQADFDWLTKRIESAQTLSYDTFCSTATTFLSRQNHRRLAVLMEGQLTPQNLFRYESITPDEARSIGSYVTAK